MQGVLTRMRTPASALLLFLLGACAGPASEPVLGRPGDFLPLERGSRWTYRVLDGERALTLETHRIGGDVRSLPGEGERVRFDFVYGRLAGEQHDVTKSIYAMAADGPRLYYFDAYSFGLWFDPPLALLPPEVRPGSEWTWRGEADLDAGEVPSTARLSVAAFEDVEVPAGTFRAVRVVQVHDVPDVRITCWYARGVGLVRMDVAAPGDDAARRGVRLLSHSPARADGQGAAPAR